MSKFLHLPILFTFLISCVGSQRDDIVIEDFESASYAKWNVSGESFTLPQHTDSIPQLQGVKGNYFLTSIYKPNERHATSEGKINRAITIERDYIEFYISGGKHTTRECIVLLIDNKIVCQATGQNDHLMRKVRWDVKKYFGREAILEVLDAQNNDHNPTDSLLSYINIDHIIQTDVLKETKDSFVFESFDTPLTTNWQVKGTAFTTSSKRKPAYYPLIASNYEGKSFLTSFNPDDGSVGELRSKKFQIEHDCIEFYVGGGKHKKTTYIKLIVENEEIYSATGDNSGTLRKQIWDVTQFKGKNAYIEIVDNYRYGWGHILIDEIKFTKKTSFLLFIKSWFWLFIIPISILAIYLLIRKYRMVKLRRNCISIHNDIVENQAYLNPNLKLKIYSQKFNISFQQIDQFFKFNYDLDFTSFVNSQRVDYFKKELIKSDNKNLTILAIAEKSGFKSKTAFYRIFKEFEHITPTEYKQNSQNR